MSDDSDSNSNSFSNWSPPSYGLTSPGTGLTFGNTTVNTGDYSLGGSGGLLGNYPGSSGGGGNSLNFGDTTYTPGYTPETPTYGFTGDSNGGFNYSTPDYGSLDYQQGFLNDMFKAPKPTANDATSIDSKIGLGLSTAPITWGDSNDSEKSRNNYLMTLAGQAKANGENFSTLLGREPTYKELQALKEGGFGNMYGVNPNNLEGQNVEHMIAAQNVGNFLDKASGMLPGMGLAKGITGMVKGYQQGQSFGDLASNFASGMAGPIGALGSAFKGDYGNAVAKLAPGIGGAVAGLGVDAAMGRDVTNPGMMLAAKYAGNRLAGPIGGSIGGKVMASYLGNNDNKPATGGTEVANNSSIGGLIGTFLGGGSNQTVNGINGQVQVGQGQGPEMRASSGSFQPSTGQSILSGLSTLYNGNQAADALSRVSSSAGQQNDSLLAQQAALKSQLDQMPTLAAMYGQDSPYAKQLRETLARKDAAAGRNSQYGAREVNFQAQLADKANSYASQQAQLAAQLAQSQNLTNSQINANNTQSNTAAQQLAALRAQQLAAMYNVADKSGVVDWIGSGLGSLFGGGSGAGISSAGSAGKRLVGDYNYDDSSAQWI